MNNSILKNDLLRNYPERDAKNFTVLVVNCSIIAITILISITGNSLIVLSILKNHSLHSPSMILIFGLALSDLLLGLVAQPLYIAKELSDYLSLQSACYFFLHNCCGVSLWTMTAISLDRLAALHLHMKYTSLVTLTRVTQVLGTIWIVIHLSFGIYFWNERAYFFLAGCFVLICLTLASFSYTRIFQIVLSTSETNSQPAPISAKSWCLLYPNLEAIQEKRSEHFHILPVFIIISHSINSHHDSFRDLPELVRSMEHLYNSDFHEFFY